MGLSIRAYAKSRGVSDTSVHKAINSGRIQKEADGTIDPAKADKDWAANTKSIPPIQNRQQPQNRQHPQNRQQLSVDTEKTGVSAPPNYQQARAIRETYSAKMAKLEYEARIRTLLPASEVKEILATVARGVRDKMESIPRRMAPFLVVETDVRKAEYLLREEIRKALAELARWEDLA